MKQRPPIRLTREGILFLGSALLIVATGALITLPILVLWGLVFLAVGVVAYPLTLRALLAIQASGLTVECDPLMGPSGGLVAGETATALVRCTNTGPLSVAPLDWFLATTQGLRVKPGSRSVLIQPHSTTQWRIDLAATRAGPAHVQGLHLTIAGPLGLFRFPCYRKIGRVVSVLPRSASTRSRTMGSPARSLDSQADNPLSLPRPGMSLEIRELREHLPGDSFRHIAWKASARQGKLMVKEYEAESNRSHVYLLDISPSMRWGALGQTPLDYAIEATFHLARSAAQAKDRVGLITFDRDVYGVTRTATGPKVVRQVLAHLLELHAVVHESHTDIDPDELCMRVADFVRVQHGVDFRVDLSFPESNATLNADLDEAAMVHFLNRELGDSREHKRVQRAALATPPSTDPMQATIRTFCQQRGIEIPYRSEWLPAQKEQGIAASIEKMLALGAGPHTLFVITNLLGVDNPERLLQVLNVARANHHQVQIHCVPDHVGSPATHRQRLEGDLEELLREELHTRRWQTMKTLREGGIRVLAPRIG